MSWQTLAPTLYGDQTHTYFGGAGAMSNDGTALVTTSLSGDFINLSSEIPLFDLNLKYYRLINNIWTLKASTNIPLSMGIATSISADGTKIALQYNILSPEGQNIAYINLYSYTNNQLNFLSKINYNRISVVMDMSKDGNYIAFGNPEDNNNSGLVDIYSIASTPIKISTLNGQPGEGFGNRVSLSNDASIVAVVSNYDNSYTGNDISTGGRITLFTRNNTSFTPFHTITTTENGYFNSIRVKLSSNGEILLVGLPEYNNIKGRIETYLKSGNTYIKIASSIDGVESYNQFGNGMTLSGDDQVLCLFKDAPNNSSNLPTSFIFYRWNGTAWIDEQATIGNLNVYAKGPPLVVNLNHTGSIFMYSYSEYISSGWTLEMSAGAIYTLIRGPIENNTDSLPCFPAGTKVQTTSGPVPVEHLTSSHQILTADGRAVTFKLYKTEISKTTQATAPYTIPAHTFAHNSPVADLTLSPLHAVQMRPGLWHIPKYAAKQYSKITQPTIGAPTTYYHIELPNYFTDNIITEGTVVESFGANQTKGLQTVYRYNSTLQGFTRISQPLQSKHALLK